MVKAQGRVGVALVLDPPICHEVDGLRRALGDPSLGRIPPHLTLVPPVNVRADDMGSALERLRSAAARQDGPLELTLGPVATFWPANPVLHLEVGGDLEQLRRLRDAVFVAPLARKLSWPWVPHVTVADGTEEDRIDGAVRALGRYSAVTIVDRLVMLEEDRGRTWSEIADVALGRPAVIGTGGLPLEIFEGRLIDPQARWMLEQAGVQPTGPSFYLTVLTARREGETVGVAGTDALGQTSVFVRPDVRRQGIGTHLKGRLDLAIRRRRPHTGPVS